MDNELLELYSWIVRGKQRRAVLMALEGIKTPTQIKGETKLGLNNVSDILRMFVRLKIANCLNEEQKTGRLYRLTNQGLKLKKKLYNT